MKEKTKTKASKSVTSSGKPLEKKKDKERQKKAKKAVQAPLAQDDLEVLCVCAVRYSLGRGSYIVSLVCDILKELELTTPTIKTLITDVQAYLASPHICDYNDDRWQAFLTELTTLELLRKALGKDK